MENNLTIRYRIDKRDLQRLKLYTIKFDFDRFDGIIQIPHKDYDDEINFLKKLDNEIIKMTYVGKSILWYKFGCFKIDIVKLTREMKIKEILDEK